MSDPMHDDGETPKKEALPQFDNEDVLYATVKFSGEVVVDRALFEGEEIMLVVTGTVDKPPAHGRKESILRRIHSVKLSGAIETEAQMEDELAALLQAASDERDGVMSLPFPKKDDDSDPNQPELELVDSPEPVISVERGALTPDGANTWVVSTVDDVMVFADLNAVKNFVETREERAATTDAEAALALGVDLTEAPDDPWADRKDLD